MGTMDLTMSHQGSQLRKTLNLMFPAEYINLYHKPSNIICSPLALKPISFEKSQHIRQTTSRSDNSIRYEVSNDPISRANVIYLCNHLDSSLTEHQAKPIGLCPVRRTIYDQCFDELIRQITVGCVEQGLLLFRIKGELKQTLQCHKVAYESGVEFGLKKAIKAEQELERYRCQIEELEKKLNLMHTGRDQELKEESDSLNAQAKEANVTYYETQIAIKDAIIERQRAVIRAISQECISKIAPEIDFPPRA